MVSGAAKTTTPALAAGIGLLLRVTPGRSRDGPGCPRPCPVAIGARLGEIGEHLRVARLDERALEERTRLRLLGELRFVCSASLPLVAVHDEERRGSARGGSGRARAGAPASCSGRGTAPSARWCPRGTRGRIPPATARDTALPASSCAVAATGVLSGKFHGRRVHAPRAARCPARPPGNAGKNSPPTLTPTRAAPSRAQHHQPAAAPREVTGVREHLEGRRREVEHHRHVRDVRSSERMGRQKPSRATHFQLGRALAQPERARPPTITSTRCSLPGPPEKVGWPPRPCPGAARAGCPRTARPPRVARAAPRAACAPDELRRRRDLHAHAGHALPPCEIDGRPHHDDDGNGEDDEPDLQRGASHGSHDMQCHPNSRLAVRASAARSAAGERTWKCSREPQPQAPKCSGNRPPT